MLLPRGVCVATTREQCLAPWQLLFVAGGRIPSTWSIRLWKVQRTHILVVELEVVDGGIVFDAFGGHAFWERHVALSYRQNCLRKSHGSSYLLQAPTQEHVSPALSMLLANLLEHGLIATLTANNGAISLDDDVALLAPLNDVVPW